jgi:hypothetical protein
LRCWQSWLHPTISDAMQRHTTLEDIRRLVALIPEWAKECITEKTTWGSCTGANSEGGPQVATCELATADPEGTFTAAALGVEDDDQTNSVAAV